MVLDLRVRQRGFDQHDPRTIARPVVSGKNRLLQSLDIDLEEMHRLPRRHMALPDNGKREHGDFLRANRITCSGMLLRDLVVGSRQPRVVDETDDERAFALADRHVEIDVQRPAANQFLEIARMRFDVDPPPAGQAECLRHRVRLLPLCADIDVEAMLHIQQGAPQHHILVVLCVRDELRHGGAWRWSLGGHRAINRARMRKWDDLSCLAPAIASSDRV